MSDFPNQPIRILTSRAGNHIDSVTQAIAQGIAGPLGQPVTVEHAAELLPGEIVSHAPPDGHTLLFMGGNFWYRSLMQKTPYDPVQDFLPITLAAVSPLIVALHPSVAAHTLAEFIALAKARPGRFSYGSGLNGSASQLAGALFTYMAGIDMVRVPYKTGGFVGVDDLIAGKVQMMIPSAGAAMPHVKFGRLRALAVTSAASSALAPELPTVAATLPGYEMVQSLAIFAPAKTPAPTIQRLNREIVAFLKTAHAKKQLLDVAVEAVGSTPEELTAKINSEMIKWRAVIKNAAVAAN